MIEPVDMADANEEIAKYGEWTECQAFRWVREGDAIRLEITRRPPCQACSAKGYVVQAAPGHRDVRIECTACGGSGRAAQ